MPDGTDIGVSASAGRSERNGVSHDRIEVCLSCMVRMLVDDRCVDSQQIVLEKTYRVLVGLGDVRL